MSAPKTYYKVIRTTRKSVLNTAMPVTYPINKWATPRIKGTPLMVFESFDFADKFKASQAGRVPPITDSLIIVPCHIKKMRSKVSWLNWNIDSIDRVGLMTFWKRCKNHRTLDFYPGSAFNNFVPGTVFASEVKCLE